MAETIAKPRERPQLRELGTIADLTLQQNKKLGPSDGNLFQGNPISNT